MKLINKNLLLTLGMALTLTLSACTGCSQHTWSSESSLSSIESSESESSQSSSESSSSEISSSEISSSEISSSESSSSEEPIVYHVVTFYANGGYFPGSVEVLSHQVEEGECVALPPEPEKEYADFLGWFEDGKTVAFDFTRPIYSDVDLYASWHNEEALIISSEIPNSTLDEENRTIDVTVYEGDRYYLSIINQLTLSDGASYAIYYEGVECDPNSLSITHINQSFDIVVTSKYGHFTTDYTLNVYKDYEVTISYYIFDELYHYETIQASDLYTITYNPGDQAGYHFQHWSLSNVDYRKVTTIEATKDVSLYAWLDEIIYDCVLDANGGVFSNGNSTKRVLVTVTSILKCEVPTYTGYRFLGFFHDDEQVTDENGNGLSSWHFLDRMRTTIVAHWEQINYAGKITFDLNGADSLYGPFPEHIYYGETYTVPKTMQPWERFLGWWCNGVQVTDREGNSLQPWSFEDDKEYTFIAHFEIPNMVVEFYLNDELIHTQTKSIDEFLSGDYPLWVYETDNPTYYGWSYSSNRESYYEDSIYLVYSAYQVVFEDFTAKVYAWIDEQEV